MVQRVRKSFFGGRGIGQARARPWLSRALSDLVSRTVPLRSRLTLPEVLAAIVAAPSTWAAVPTASSPPTVSYGAPYETPDTTKLGGVAWKRYWFRGDNGQPENTGGGRTLLQRADFNEYLTQGGALGGGVNYNNNSGNSTEWWVSYAALLRRFLNAGTPDTQSEADIGNFSGWSWGFTLTGRGFAISGQSYTDAVVYVEEGGVLKRCPYQDRPQNDTYAYFDFGTSATRNILLVIPPVGWSSEILIPTTASMVPWSGWRTGRLSISIMGDSYFQDVYNTNGRPSGEQFSILLGGGPTPSVSAQGGSGYASDNSDATNVRPFYFPHRLNRAAVGQPDAEGMYGGINDGWPTTTTSAGEVSTAWAIDKTLREKRLRNAPALLFVGSPWAPNGPNGQNPAGKYQQINNYLQAALARDPGPWIFIDSLNGTWKTSAGTQRATAEGPWITGTGNTGAPNGSGNADIYIGPDGTHPSDAGRGYFAEKNSQYMHEAAASMLTGNVYNLSASDAIALADGSGIVVVAIASATDAGAAADGATSTATGAATAVDAAAAVDTASSQAAMPVAASDAVAATDSAAGPAVRPAAVSDAVTASDAAASAGATAASASDSAAASDVAAALAAAGAAAADAVSASDSVSIAGVVSASASDAAAAGDSSAAVLAAAASASDAAAATDASAAQMTRGATATDAAAAADSATTQAVQALAAIDAVAANDTAQALTGGTLIAADAASAGDAAGAQAVRPMPVADAVSATDAAGATAVLQLAVADAVAAADAATTQAVFAVLAAETFTAVDSALAMGSFALATSEGFVLTDMALAVAQATYVFVRDERTYRVPGEDRVYRVAAEDRAYRALPEYRTYKASK